ncbi:hypothetical protein V6N12_050612 [Hibiscus sabdariffa]|uniref:Uncharacterized protein n=1 Tax=Hibiscus sabdariffa TaxID=183260 RepID=A0ABR2GCW6_9ROSI
MLDLAILTLSFYHSSRQSHLQEGLADFSHLLKEVVVIFALKFDRVNCVEVEMIFSWRLKIQEHREIREVPRFLISPDKDSSVVFSG